MKVFRHKITLVTSLSGTVTKKENKNWIKEKYDAMEDIYTYITRSPFR